MSDYPVIRCLHDGYTLKKLPAAVDPRGRAEVVAYGKAYTDYAWRKLRALVPALSVRALPKNVLRFGAAAKS